MPAIDPREFVRELDNVLTLLQPAQISLLPTAPEDEHAWPSERNMLVWKNEQNSWHFKMLLHGEQYQGLFDSNLDDDRRVIAGLNALEINPDAPEEISEQLGPDVCARIARPYLHMSINQQKQIIAPLALSACWPLESNKSDDVNIQTCLTLLRGEANHHDFSLYLTLDHIHGLVGGRVAEFNADNSHVTLGDVLRFIQLLLIASVRALGHDEAMVLPSLPEGHDRKFLNDRRVDDGQHALDFFEARRILTQIQRDQERNQAFQSLLPVTEAELVRLTESVPNLSAADHALVAQSLTALREATAAWTNSNQDLHSLLTFKRTTDDVLRAEHIQRLYTRPRFPALGMFSDRVDSPELQALKLSLRDLRDISAIRELGNLMIKLLYEAINIMLQIVTVSSVLFMLVSANLMFLLNAPLIFIMLSAFQPGCLLGLMVCANVYYVSQFINQLWNSEHHFVDVLKAIFEANREFFTHDLPLLLASTLVVSACYALAAAKVSTGLAILASVGTLFGIGFSAVIAVGMIWAVGFGAYQAFDAVTQAWDNYFNHDELNQYDEPELVGANLPV